MKALIFTFLAGTVLFTSIDGFAQSALPKSPGCLRHYRESRSEPTVLKKIVSMGHYTNLFGTWEKSVLGKRLSILISANNESFALRLTQGNSSWGWRNFQVCDVPGKPKTLKLLLDSSPFKNGDKDIIITMGEDGLLDVKLDWIKQLSDVPRVSRN